MRTFNVECSPLALVSRLGEPRESRPDGPGASTHASKFLIPTPSPPPLTSTPESHDMLALSALSSIANVARTRVRPRAPGGARHGADDCGAQKTSESKRSRGPRENSKVTKNTHRVCRRSLEKPKTQHDFILPKSDLARLRRGSSSALRSDGLVGYDVSFTRRRSGVRTPVGLFFAFCDCLHCRECFLAVLLVSWLFKRDGVFLGPAVARSAQRHPRRGGAREKREERRAQPRRWESRGRT